MNKFVISALVLSATSSLAIAGSETKEWSSLDRDIENLASSLAAPGSGFGASGFVRTRYNNSGDTTPDTSGVSMDNVRVNFAGNAGDYGVFVSLENAFGIAVLFDAYATFPIGAQVNGRFGQFRAPVLWSGLLDENNLILLDKTINGAIWSFRDPGFMINGSFEQLGWWIALQNGADGLADEYALSGRVAFNALGTGVGMQEGAYGAPADSNLTIGIGYYDDGAVTDGTATAIDAAFTRGALSAHAEMVDYDVGFGDATPWSGTIGWMVTPNEWEIAGRYEDLDDAFDTNVMTVGVNRYIQGHNAKWGLNWSTVNSDSAALEVDMIGLGLTVGV